MYQHQELVAHANRILGEAHGRINRSLGLRDRFGISDLEPSSVYDQVCASRFLKKFQEPSDRGQSILQDACYAEWLHVEEDLSRIHFDSIPNHHKSILYKARQLLHVWCADVKPAHVTEFTPGESFISQKGRTSVIRKLASPKHWTVTYDAFDDFAALCYKTTGLKRAARRLMKPLTAADAKALYSNSENAFEAFSQRLLEVVTLVHGSRLSSVPKNNEKRRAINVEATGNMLLQRTLAQPLRSVCTAIGNDLELGQQVHRRRISDPTLATVDFSSASDRISLEIVMKLFPSSVTRYVSRWRSQMVLVDGVYHLPAKFSSMGCGFTFEVMTLLLLAVARVLDSDATVYGDDVIISNECAQQFIDVCTSFGMKVNTDKSFIRTPFRESCGAYYHDDLGYIVSYDFAWCTTWFDVTVACNKLRNVLRHHPTKSGVLYEALDEAYQQLLSLAPALTRGHACDDISSGFIHFDDASRMKRDSMADVQCKKLHNHVLSVVRTAFTHWQLPITFQVVKLWVFRPKTGWKCDGKFRDQGPKYLASLLNGTLAHDTIRGEGEWVQKLAVTSPEGGVWLYKDLKEIKWIE